MKFFKRLSFLTILFLLPLIVCAQNRARTFDVQHYIIRSSFDRPAKTLFGDVVVQLKPLKDGFNSVTLDSAGMTFESVTSETGNVNLPYRQEAEKLIITLDKSYSPADVVSIRFKYSAKPAKGVYFVEATEEHSSQIWTQGEAEEAHHWFPSYDFPDDKASTEQYITVPRDETAVANGNLLEIIENPNGSKTFHYKMPVAHAIYLTSMVVGKYVKIEDKYNQIPLGYYVYPGKEALAQSAFGKTPDMLKNFEELTGVNFPYNKYDQTIVANFQFGGMENITATTMADTEIFASAYMPNEVMDLVSHELAHSWFGNLVTCKNWSELWLNEGFATFMEAAYRERAVGRADYLRKIRQDALGYMTADIVNPKRHGLFFVEARGDDSLFDAGNAAVAYQKGGAVIHTLRGTIGDASFWKGVNIYLNRHKFANVETADLKKAMEEASGKDLTWFFDQWVYKAGFPQLSVKQTYNTRNRKLSLTVSQTQKTDAVTPAAFILPLEIEVKTAKGAKTTLLNINKRTQVFSIQTDGKPLKIEVDKDHKIPLKLVKILPPPGAPAAVSR